MTGKRILRAEDVPADVRIEEIHSVGRYGLAPRFSDGHDTGIFHIERLRAMADRRGVESAGG
jgi:DUF971 family protein